MKRIVAILLMLLLLLTFASCDANDADSYEGAHGSFVSGEGDGGIPVGGAGLIVNKHDAAGVRAEVADLWEGEGKSDPQAGERART